MSPPLWMNEQMNERMNGFLPVWGQTTAEGTAGPRDLPAHGRTPVTPGEGPMPAGDAHSFTVFVGAAEEPGLQLPAGGQERSTFTGTCCVQAALHSSYRCPSVPTGPERGPGPARHDPACTVATPTYHPRCPAVSEPLSQHLAEGDGP